MGRNIIQLLGKVVCPGNDAVFAHNYGTNRDLILAKCQACFF